MKNCVIWAQAAHSESEPQHVLPISRPSGVVASVPILFSSSPQLSPWWVVIQFLWLSPETLNRSIPSSSE